MRRPGYRDAITWIARNDDCYWLGGDEEAPPSVTASMVVDLFEVDTSKVISDLIKELRRVHPAHAVLKRFSK